MKTKTPKSDKAPKLRVEHFHFVQTEERSKLYPVQIEVRSNLVNVGCLGAKCAMWDDANKRCLATVEVIDGMLLLLHDAQ